MAEGDRAVPQDSPWHWFVTPNLHPGWHDPGCHVSPDHSTIPQPIRVLIIKRSKTPFLQIHHAGRNFSPSLQGRCFHFFSKRRWDSSAHK